MHELTVFGSLDEAEVGVDVGLVERVRQLRASEVPGVRACACAHVRPVGRVSACVRACT